MCGRQFPIMQPVLKTGSQNGQGSRHIAFGSLLGAPPSASFAAVDGELEGVLDADGVLEADGELEALLLGVLLGE
jgi:hypothetical protein